MVLGDPEATAREFAFYSETIPPEKFTKERVFIPQIQPKMERGEMTPWQYYEHFLLASGCRISFRHFGIIWAKYFIEIEPMITFGRTLSREFKVYFLSNANPLHIPVLYTLFPSLLFFHGDAISYELGALKPESAFFERALAKLGLAADECLFIDDLAANVETARKLGIRSIQHLDPEETKSRITAELDKPAI